MIPRLFKRAGLPSLAALLLAGCPLVSFQELCLDALAVVSGAGWDAAPPAVFSGDVIYTPPASESGETAITVSLDNSRNLSLALALGGGPAPGQARLELEHPGSSLALIRIYNAAEGDEFSLSLKIGTADGLRVFEPYALPRIRCVSFETGVRGLYYREGGAEREFIRDPGLGYWAARVGHLAGTADIRVEPMHPQARVTIGPADGPGAGAAFTGAPAGGNFLPGAPLHRGENYFRARVQAPGGSEQFYSLMIFQEQNNAGVLSRLELKAGGQSYALTPAFIPGSPGGSYALEVPISVTGLTLEAEAAPGASIDGGGPGKTAFINLIAGTTVVSITVAAEDGAETSVYVLTIRRQSSTGVSVSYSDGPADESFSITAANLSWTDNEPITFYAPAGYAGYLWYLDGAEISGAVAFSLNKTARDFSLGLHKIAVVVEKDGRPYSKECEFEVVP